MNLTSAEMALANANNAMLTMAQASGSAIAELLNAISALREENASLKDALAKATTPAEQGKAST